MQNLPIFFQDGEQWVSWTEDEFKEINLYLKPCLPKQHRIWPQQCQHLIKAAHSVWHTLVKKISYMNHVKKTDNT